MKTLSKEEKAELGRQRKEAKLDKKVLKQDAQLRNLGQEKPFYQSKKFWGSVLSLTVPAVNRYFALELAVEEVAAFMSPFILYVFGQAKADQGKNSKGNQ